MKINLRQQFLGLALIATLGVGGFGSLAFRRPAQPTVHPVAQSATVAATGTDTDTIEAGDQTGVDSVKDSAEDPSTGPDTDNVQDGPGSQVEDGQPDVPGAAEEPAGP